MGRKSKDETVARVFQAFLEKPTWTQADLARHLGVGARRVREVLLSLAEAQIPLEREEEHPHVYWSVPKGWIPGGIALTKKEHADLIRYLLHLEADAIRDALLERVVAAARASAPRLRAVDVGTAAADHQVLRALEEAAERGVAVDVKYSRAGKATYRTITPGRVVLRPHPRLAAYCHSSGKLKWYRIDRVLRVVDADDAAIRPESDELEAFVRASVDGFHGETGIGDVTFAVTPEAADWVARNLPPGVQRDATEGSELFRASGAGMEPLARFVTGLGAAITFMSPELAHRVREIATEALGAANRVGGVPRPKALNQRPARSKRRTG